MNKLAVLEGLLFVVGEEGLTFEQIEDVLELNEEEAAGYMRELIKTAEDNWRTNVYDFIQKKQNNISY